MMVQFFIIEVKLDARSLAVKKREQSSSIMTSPFEIQDV
jgi:hypothetical protein